MRPKSRIPRIIKKLEKLWNKVPDWRLGQMISNLSGTQEDIFFPEDEEWEVRIDNLTKKIK